MQYKRLAALPELYLGDIASAFPKNYLERL